MWKFVQDGYIVIIFVWFISYTKLKQCFFVFCVKLTLNNSDKMELFSHEGVNHTEMDE